ncbi:hypothetical protein FKP32DRAFT_1677340 [Trametes sanguinea]|nr:hypothetical protein FKP32DRAFT_1677340 [Trametes sanguinea]
MSHAVTGLSYEEWVSAFLPTDDGGIEVDLESKYGGLFKSIPMDKEGYDKPQILVDIVNEANILGEFMLSVTRTYAGKDKPNPEQKRLADVVMHPKGCGSITGPLKNWAAVEISIKCTEDENCGPYDTDNEALEHSMTPYEIVAFKWQQRTHHFGVVLGGSSARLGRWDRAGVVFSAKFDYIQEPGKLVGFLWRVAHATPEARGHDPTAHRVLLGSHDYDILLAWKAQEASLSEDDYVKQRFVKSLADDRSWWRITVADHKYGQRDFLVGHPTFATSDVVGRGTKGYIALCVSDPGTPLVFLKDCWRVDDGHSELEGDILSYLNEKGVVNVPTALYHGYVAEQRTVSQDVCERAKGTSAHRHYRLVVKEVGLPLQEFPCGRILVWVIRDAVIAHQEAYTKAGVMHRDISVGNILIIPPYGKDKKTTYQGLLADWELSKRLGSYQNESRYPDPAGTWQFMSVHMHQNPGAQPQIADELESFLNVMIYCAVRYLPHTCKNVGDFLYHFFDDAVVDTCGLLKCMVMKDGTIITRRGTQIIFLRRPRDSNAQSISNKDWHPINDIIDSLLACVSARYQLLRWKWWDDSKGDDDWDDDDDDDDDDESDSESEESSSDDSSTSSAMDHAREDMLRLRNKLMSKSEKLESHEHMIKLLKKASDKKARRWPGPEDRLPDQLYPRISPTQPE